MRASLSKGVEVDRRSDSMSVSDWPGSLYPDSPARNASRWTLVSTSLSALIVSSVAWLAVSTMPHVTPVGVEKASQGFMPYRFFQQITQSGRDMLFGGAAHASEPATPQADLDTALAVENATPKPNVETRTIVLERGDTLAGVMQNSGISSEDSIASVAALAKIMSPRTLRAGQSFNLTYSVVPVSDAEVAKASLNGDAQQDSVGEPINRLLTIKFSPTVDHDITITRGADGVYTAADTVKQLVSHVHRAGATIDGSLYLSAMRAGIPADVVVEMIRMFSYKVDFQRDLHPGDSFEVFYNYYYTKEGQPAKQGDITYAMMHLGNSDISLYRYQPDPNQPAEYYDAKGQSAKGLLMKTPVDGARITSRFGVRYHPVLGYTRMHKGVDFGVPVGTPVMAAGSGTISFMGWAKGYGRFVVIKHGNGYSTAYGHLSRFAGGLRKGSRVRQAQVVAYSGNTGITTGPHLHYEIRMHNKQVNPLKVKFAQGRKLSGKELHAYQTERMHIDDMLASTKLETKVADIASSLRATQ